MSANLSKFEAYKPSKVHHVPGLCKIGHGYDCCYEAYVYKCTVAEHGCIHARVDIDCRDTQLSSIREISIVDMGAGDTVSVICPAD